MDDSELLLLQGIETLVSYLESKKNWEPRDYTLQATLLHLIPKEAGFRERRSTSLGIRVRLLRLGNRLP